MTFTPENFRDGLEARDPELSEYFEAHKEDFRIGERRTIRNIVVETQKVRAG